MKRIASGHPAAPREQTYAMFELMHAVRDNLKIDLRESSSSYFRQLPIDQLAGHYPAALRTPENEFRVPVYVRDGDPDVNDCTMARAAELAMVGYDDNAVETQFVQGLADAGSIRDAGRAWRPCTNSCGRILISRD